MAKVRTVTEGERFLHKDLWRVVGRQLDHAAENLNENAERARDDIREFIDTIHKAAIPKVNDIWFGEAAFGGTLQYSTRSSKLAT